MSSEPSRHLFTTSRVKGNERTDKLDKLAKGAVQEVGARLLALADWRKRLKQAKRGKRVLAYRPELADKCTSDNSREDNNDGGEGGLGHHLGQRPAVSTSPPADSSGSIRHRRFGPEPISGLVRLQSSAKGRLIVALVVILDWRPTSRHHHLSSRSLPPASTRHSRAASRRSSHSFGPALATSVPTRRISNPNDSCALATASQRPVNTSSSTARSTPSRARPSSPPSNSHPPHSPISSGTRAKDDALFPCPLWLI